MRVVTVQRLASTTTTTTTTTLLTTRLLGKRFSINSIIEIQSQDLHKFRHFARGLSRRQTTPKAWFNTINKKGLQQP